MPRHTGLLDHDEASGKTKLFHRLHDGDWAVQTVQDIDAVLDANKEAQNHCNPNSADGSLRLVARIPAIFIEKWLREKGINFYDPNHQGAVAGLLNSSEYRWLRTDNSVL